MIRANQPPSDGNAQLQELVLGVLRDELVWRGDHARHHRRAFQPGALAVLDPIVLALLIEALVRGASDPD